MNAIIKRFPVPAPELTRLQLRAIELISGGFPIYKVAEMIAVGAIEIDGWYTDKRFAEELEARIARRRLQAKQMIEARAVDAVEHLGTLLEDESKDISIRAAESIIRHTAGMLPSTKQEITVTKRVELTEAQLLVLERIAGARHEAALSDEIPEAEYTETAAGDAEVRRPARGDFGGDDGEGA